MNINWLKKISNKNQHDAFTDLNCLNNQLYLCFRRATDHHSPDGIVVLQRLNLQGKLVEHKEFSLLNSDLRDPKLTIIDDNKLLLTAYARTKYLDKEGNESKISQNIYWKSNDGMHWEQQTYFASPFHWCWRLSKNDNLLYSLAYERKTESLYLYSGRDLKHFEASEKPVLSKTEHDLGYPNESDLCFVTEQSNSKAIAIVRRDADTYSTQLGKSLSPYTIWQWQDLPIYLASPKIILCSESDVLIAARYEHSELTSLSENQIQMLEYFGSGNEKIEYKNEQLKTGLFKLDLRNDKLTLLLPLPSAADNGYPGLIIQDSSIWVSYYSTPESGKTQVYLCHINTL
jgi:hypothetical protein